MWFKKLTGCDESKLNIHSQISVADGVLKCKANGRQFTCGFLETPLLEELRNQVQLVVDSERRLQLSEIVANVQKLHADPNNENALFQVASQFNLLEMVSPSVTPEAGIGIYENDRTQGPACAIACGAGTIFRNYFVEVDGQVGQTAMKQIDCLSDVGIVLGNVDSKLWQMRNGYALATADGLREISRQITGATEEVRDEFRGKLRIGLQWDTEVTISKHGQLVSQAFCSALPVAYSEHAESLWAEFAQLVLEASYEATVCAAIMNWRRTGCNKLFLTLVGGGAFGNRMEWILSAIERALRLYAYAPLDVFIVSHGASKRDVQSLISHWRR